MGQALPGTVAEELLSENLENALNPSGALTPTSSLTAVHQPPAPAAPLLETESQHGSGSGVGVLQPLVHRPSLVGGRGLPQLGAGGRGLPPLPEGGKSGKSLPLGEAISGARLAPHRVLGQPGSPPVQDQPTAAQGPEPGPRATSREELTRGSAGDGRHIYSHEELHVVIVQLVLSLMLAVGKRGLDLAYYEVRRTTGYLRTHAANPVPPLLASEELRV